MKIPNIAQIRKCDAYTIENEPILSIDLMERAAKTCFEHLTSLFQKETTFLIFCGMGNNGGDGLALTRMLLEASYQAKAIVLFHKENFSIDCQINFERLKNQFPQQILQVTSSEDIPIIDSDVVVDAILGSGLYSVIDNDLIKKAIAQINESKAFVFAIDIPTGFWVDKSMKENTVAVCADFTHTFAYPKLGFMFAENYPYVGNWNYYDIGLDEGCWANEQFEYFAITDDILKYFPLREKFAHKNIYGHGLLIAGKEGMMGAAVLAAKAAFRTGIGLLTVHVPKIGYSIVQTSVNEAICEIDKEESLFSSVEFSSLSKYTAIAVGPGLGTENCTAQGIKRLIADYGGTIVFDADAINILAQNKTWLNFISPYCIFTPHIKEFERLTRKATDSYDRIELQKAFSIRYKVIVVLKGAHTCVSLPDGTCYFNLNGNSGMATAGSGDVLTGIILSLLCQGVRADIAAMLGVYLHGRSADIAVENQSQASLIASDIVENLKNVLK